MDDQRTHQLQPLSRFPPVEKDVADMDQVGRTPLFGLHEEIQNEGNIGQARGGRRGQLWKICAINV